MTDTPKKSRRGFAAMSPEKRREIARMGGRTSHARGTANVFKEGKEAAEIGRRGGLAAHAKRRAAKAAEAPSA